MNKAPSLPSLVARGGDRVEEEVSHQGQLQEGQEEALEAGFGGTGLLAFAGLL